MKYPIGIQDFAQIIEDGYVYVDKTEMVYSLANNGYAYILCRPPKFGKSLLVSTLEYYFRGRRDLFKGLAIDKLETEWTEYPVFHIDFSGEDYSKDGVLEKKIESILQEWEQQYGKHPFCKIKEERFAYVLEQAHKQTGRRAVVLIDEYDKPITDVLDTNPYTMRGCNRVSLEEANRCTLGAFYSTLKSACRDLKFILMTGVTRFTQNSSFNQVCDIGGYDRYEAICGITFQEMKTYFSESVTQFAQKERCTEDDIWEKLQRVYKGYSFSSAMTDIYNPFSVFNALDKQEISDYWFADNDPSSCIRLLNRSGRDLNWIAGQYHNLSMFVDFMAGEKKPSQMLYWYGYLTIKGYHCLTHSYLLDFPNNEVRKGFLTMVANDYLKSGKDNVEAWLTTAARELRRGNLEQFMQSLTAFLADIPYTMRRKKEERERERYFHYTFYLLLRLLANYTTYTEKEQSKGRVDCIVDTSDYIYIFEFKLDGTAGEALRQIDEKGYARPYATDPRKLYRIGVNFSSEEGTVEGYLIAE